MNQRRLQSRIVIWLLVMHLAHLPFPWWDGDALVRYDGPGPCLAAPSPPMPLSVPKDGVWDIDFVLLGIDPPDDSDEGPFDDDPEHPDRSFFGPRFILQRVVKTQFRLAVSLVDHILSVQDAGRSTPVVSGRVGSSLRTASFGATFDRPQGWRTLLSTLVC